MAYLYYPVSCIKTDINVTSCVCRWCGLYSLRWRNTEFSAAIFFCHCIVVGGAISRGKVGCFAYFEMIFCVRILDPRLVLETITKNYLNKLWQKLCQANVQWQLELNLVKRFVVTTPTQPQRCSCVGKLLCKPPQTTHPTHHHRNSTSTQMNIYWPQLQGVSGSLIKCWSLLL